MKKLKQQFAKILSNCKAHEIDTNQLKSVQKFLIQHNSKIAVKIKKRYWISFVIGAIVYCLHYYGTHLQSKYCLLEQPNVMRYAFRPPENCQFCENVHDIERVQGITAEKFERKYAYTGTPVIVEDATQNWTALTKFNYLYFREVYGNATRPQKVLNCQFLPYTSGFKNLFDALDMPEERLKLRNNTKPWYFGWSNCNAETAEIFRQHYGRPYFLPKTSENNAIDWFFIGVAGLGAHMHIDNVRLPSWQAQLAGSKQWILAPPPECYFHCKRFDVVVNKGDIIVLDTNKWYHQTFVQPGDVSLTIGAEYD